MFIVEDAYVAINYLALFTHIKSLTKNYGKKNFSELTKK